VQAESALLERARRGDPDAFVQLLQPVDRGLRALAFRLLGTREAMDDALQEAYGKAFRSLGGFRSGSSLSTWLYRIVYNTCQDEVRRRKPELPLDGRDGAAPGHEDEVVRRIDLEAALAALPADLRALVLLVDAEGMDYRSAGDVLGIPPGTVGSRLNRARASLRAALAEEVGDHV
jgi:RNA polymerase sigma-70 factor, ECF subfamily